ncbi:hypothetical protein VNO77_03103 [Canavalia gladiata]|uniref:Uncharacterized protein n=1 Tax=Canavalia gladiata TaxID=3824 RepID=A0AAN9MZB1_CANGL
MENCSELLDCSRELCPKERMPMRSSPYLSRDITRWLRSKVCFRALPHHRHRQLFAYSLNVDGVYDQPNCGTWMLAVEGGP